MPDYRAVIRRDQAQAAVDGLAVANDLGLATGALRGAGLCAARAHQARRSGDPFQVRRAWPPLSGRRARHARCPNRATFPSEEAARADAKKRRCEMGDAVVGHYRPNANVAETKANWQPLGRVGVPEDIAKAILYMVSDDAPFMTGSIVVVDGGLTAQ